MPHRPNRGRDSEFFAVDHADGRIAFLVFYGAAGTLGTFVLADGWVIVAILAAGALVGGLLAWREYGYHHVWLESDRLVSETPHRCTSIDLNDITGVDAAFILEKGDELHVHGVKGDLISISNLGEDTERLRLELGRRLRQRNSRALNRVGPKTLKYLGLH